MRFSHFSVFALSGLSIASPVLSKRVDAISLLEDLYATVQIYTGAINATLAPLSASSNLLDKSAAVLKVGEQINLITAAVTSTTNDINALPHANATDDSPATVISEADVDAQARPKEKRQLVAVGALLALIIVEIFATVAGAIAILGLAALIIYLNPLTSALSLLILTVQLVLNVVLAGVITLLNTILASLALGLSGL